MLDNHAAYMGTKAGTDHIVRCVANEFGAKGVRANSISPGFTDTPMTSEAAKTPGVKDAFVINYPLGGSARRTTSPPRRYGWRRTNASGRARICK